MTEQDRTGVIDLERTDAAPSPTRTRRPRQRAAVVGVIAVLVVVLVVTLLAPFGRSDHTGGPGGRWRAVDVRRAFGRDATVTVITTRGSEFVALGQRRVPTDPGRVGPAVWTSPDGEHWDAAEDARFPKRPFHGFSSAAVRHGVLVATTQITLEIWRSTDLRTWRLVSNGLRESTDLYSVTRGPDGFVAAVPGPGPRTFHEAQTSTDGRSWRATGSNSSEHPVGLSPGARLHEEWVTVGPGQVNTEPSSVFRSRDAVHWSRIVGADTPARLAGPLVGNRPRTRVLGIQFEAQGTFGGELWSTRDGATWTEIGSFHAQMPVANPDHLVPAGRWWVLGGNTGTPDGKRRASMWSTPDLRHWYEMPAHLRGPKTDGTGVLVTAHRGRVVGYSARGPGGGSNLWVWTPPD